MLLADPASEAARDEAFRLLGGDKTLVQKLYRTLITQEPDQPIHILNLARASVAFGQESIAVVHMLKYLKAVPKDADVHLELAKIYDKLGRVELAARTRREAQAIQDQEAK